MSTKPLQLRASSELMLSGDVVRDHGESQEISTLRKAPYIQLDDITEVKSHQSGKDRWTARPPDLYLDYLACNHMLHLTHKMASDCSSLLCYTRQMIFWRRLRLSRTRVCLDITTYQYISHQVKIARVLGSILCSTCQGAHCSRCNEAVAFKTFWSSLDWIWTFSRISKTVVKKQNKNICEIGMAWPAVILSPPTTFVCVGFISWVNFTIFIN